MNYFIDEDYLIELDSNIPLRQANVNQYIDTSVVNYNKQLGNLEKLNNQRKLFDDDRKFLGIEKANCLFFENTRMDIALWRDLNAHGESPELIRDSCSIDQMNIGFNGASLFHYFALNAHVIDVMRHKMIT